MKICKFCGDAFTGTRTTMCMKCAQKSALMPKFAKARDRLRRKEGLPPMKLHDNEIYAVKEFAERLKRVVAIHNGDMWSKYEYIDNLVKEMVGDDNVD